MLNGIDVLYEEAIEIVHWHWSWWIFGIICLTFFGMVAIALFFSEMLNWPDVVVTGFEIVFIIFMIIMLVIQATKGYETYETHYYVTIDDTVKQSEFAEKYEVLEQKGRLYTIKLKEEPKEEDDKQ